MNTKIQEFLNKLDTPTAMAYAKSYFNTKFSEEELDQVLPLFKDSFADFINPKTKDLFINRMIAASSEETAKKVLKIANSIKTMFGIT